MKFLVLLLSALSCLQATAATSILFRNDGSRATVSITSMNKNLDAIGLFDALTAKTSKFGGRMSKNMDFTDEAGVRTLNISCLVSEAFKDQGDCFITFFRSPLVAMNPAGNTVTLTATGGNGQRLANEFVAAGAEIFVTEDGHFKIGLSADRMVLAYGP